MDQKFYLFKELKGNKKEGFIAYRFKLLNNRLSICIPEDENFDKNLNSIHLNEKETEKLYYFLL